MNAELFHPVGQEFVTIRFRRLVEIRWERRVIWRDEWINRKGAHQAPFEISGPE